jgi:hypothetical protein
VGGSGVEGGDERQPRGAEGRGMRGPDTSDGSPRTAVPGCAWGRQGKREKGESGGANEWAGPGGWG